MDIHKAQREAERDGYDSVEFIAHFPVGPTKCQWLDAYFGLFKVEGMDGYVRVKEIAEMFPTLEVEQ